MTDEQSRLAGLLECGEHEIYRSTARMVTAAEVLQQMMAGGQACAFQQPILLSLGRL